MITSDCRFCGIKFKTYSNNICCSKECKKQWTIRKNTKMCNECNEPFISADNRKKYCSKKCSGIAYSKKAGTYKFHQCKYCGVTFRNKKNSDNIFCTRNCNFKWKAEHKFSDKELREKQKAKRAKTFSQLKSGFHKKNATIGHLIAMSKGGSHTWGNIQLECMECNTSLGVKTHGQTRMVL